MHTELYLDTARLGRMCPSARRAEQDFAQLVSQSGCSLYFERFLDDGYRQLPRRVRRDLPHLKHWSGVSGLKTDLRKFVGLPADRPILLASRTAQLMRFAAYCLSIRAECILATDLEWPAYLKILRHVTAQRKRTLHIVPLRRFVFEDAASEQDITGRLKRAYVNNHCDGIFLSAVTYLGIRMPVTRLLSSLPNHPRFVVLDGAQALNHLPLSPSALACDLFLTGTQKWLRAFQPLGLAFCGRESSANWISHFADELRLQGLLDDPLLEFTTSIETGTPQAFGETVNVTPLITASAALAAVSRAGRGPDTRWPARLANTHRINDLLPENLWRRANDCSRMQSAAVLLQAQSQDTRSAPATWLRQRFSRLGVSLSAYNGGMLRLSFPSRPLDRRNLARIRRAFSLTS